jgi:hypothetical protein
MCIATPAAGAQALEAIDIDELLRSERFRAAARQLRGRTGAPLSELPPDDENLARTMAELVALAGRAGAVSADRLEHARLVLERARLERAIRRARAEGRTGIGDLARERETVLEAIHGVVTRLEKAV